MGARELMKDCVGAAKETFFLNKNTIPDEGPDW